jgi:hypothetical protein
LEKKIGNIKAIYQNSQNSGTRIFSEKPEKKPEKVESNFYNLIFRQNVNFKLCKPLPYINNREGVLTTTKTYRSIFFVQWHR